MKILCLGVAQTDSLLRISRNIVAFNHRRAAPSFQFTCWHRFNVVGIPTEVNSHPALQNELTRKFNLRSPRSRAAISGPPNVTLARIARASRKGLGYPAASNEAAALRVHLAEEVQMHVTGTEKASTLFCFTPTADHFQQILAWTLKSWWQKQNQLLHEVTASFRIEK
jgi:hypothetical protein